ncbi:MAG: PadR family transcriptional regulator [Oscillospiraceae bacterium]|nr:PadR family transcriptional regulator [Ruminococcus sp.]MBQ7003789.1 PadR family transcriptional regulator [Oscillospiraceae bacterium]MBQ7013488.1 PadR family transcriptional regulator [Oscillospiraceae bacterium]
MFPISAALLDAMVLSLVAREETYGYRITQDMQTAAKVSESTLYPVLRRLQKTGALETFDRAYMGRNRRYYRITALGEAMLTQYRIDWKEHKTQVDSILIKEDEQ